MLIGEKVAMKLKDYSYLFYFIIEYCGIWAYLFVYS